MFLWGQSIRTCATDIRRSSFLPAHVQKREPKEQREQKRRKKKHIAKRSRSWRKVFLLLHSNFSVLSSQRNEKGNLEIGKGKMKPLAGGFEEGLFKTRKGTGRVSNDTASTQRGAEHRNGTGSTATARSRC